MKYPGHPHIVDVASIGSAYLLDAYGYEGSVPGLSETRDAL